MIINMSTHATKEQINHVIERVRECGFEAEVICRRRAHRDRRRRQESRAARRSGSAAYRAGRARHHSIAQPFTLVSRELRPRATIVTVRGIPIGGPS